jgi:cytochrome bd-type quinol oxidase subunit 2
MEIIAIAALAFFVLGYLVLAGADIGVGMALPFLGRGAYERRLVIATIAPFFLANEVWLVAAAGVLVGAFPNLEGKLLSGMFPAVVVLLLGWILRDLGLWLRGRTNARAWWAICDGAVTIGSWVLALSWGWVAASVLTNTGGLATGPGTFFVAIAVAALFGMHGLAYAALRSTGEVRRRAGVLSKPSGEMRTYLLTAAGMVALGVVLGVRLPLVASAADPETLAFLLPGMGLILPFLLLAQLVVWLLFRGRVTEPSYL